MKILEGDSAECVSDCGISLRRSNRLVAKNDRLSVRKEQKRKDRRVAVREERKQRDILLTTEEDLFANLPEEMTIEILGRLPIRSVMTCKCVLKSWRHLIEGDEFGMLYTPKPGLTFIHRDMKMRYTVRDEALKPLFRFGLPYKVCRPVQIVSANGLLSVWETYLTTIFICNPMTREYVELPPLSKDTNTRFLGGFGVSKTSGQYMILFVNDRSCHVYTLGRGAGLWRSIVAPAPVPTPGIGSRYSGYAAFLNGNLHYWLAFDSQENFFICCFDLETELSTGLSVPSDYSGNRHGKRGVFILDGHLCLYCILDLRTVVIWKMNIYGDDNSWIKEYSFNLPIKYSSVYLLKVLANGDLLAASPDRQYFINPKKNGALSNETYYHSERRYSSNIDVYTPSLISLATMGFHNVQSLSFN
ncbi:putative F-box protein At1g32420 [Salvia hispanica]|uniref:putative F-box protein At1g32420 n=1 Tax=Salvia hispanica TaxID=49212 RepID=UPI0020098097|nr:putative F-box protein At1g32420 [Salvia hispanica]